MSGQVEALVRLNDASQRLWRAESLRDGLEEMVSATIDLLGADKANIQLLDPSGTVLRIAAQCGFEHDFLDFFREGSVADDCACGRVLRTNKAVVIEDIELDEAFGPFLSVARAAGYRAVLSAPLLNHRGVPLGVLSAHFRSPHRPSDTDLQWLDLYQRQAAAFVERLRSQEVLRESEERLRLALAASGTAMFDRDMRTGKCVWNETFYAMFGYAPGEVVPSRAAWIARVHPDDRATAEASVASSIDAHKDYCYECRILLPDGSVRWLRARGHIIFDADQPIRLIGLVEDITEARRQIETQQVLVAELQHRTRNLMAVVQSIAHRTLNTASSLKDFERHFSQRLHALSRVQSLLSRADDEPIALDVLLRMELEALGLEMPSDKIRLAGPRVSLRKSVVEMLALGIHELATNALKYGALENEKGRLSVTWQIAGTGTNPELVLKWFERCISTRAADAGHRGYGRTLIEQALPYSLSAQTKFELGADTLQCAIVLPLSQSGANGVRY